MLSQRIGTEVTLLGGRIKQSLRNGKATMSEMQTSAVDKTRRMARRTDYYVHDNAWVMMGVAAGVAFAAGFFLSRRNQEAISQGVHAETPEVQEKVKKLSSWEFVHSSIPLALFLWKAIQASRCSRKGMV